jgi:hypothetical protein
MAKLTGNFSTETVNSIAIFLILLVCYGYVFPRWADPNQNSRLNMVVALVEDRTFQIDKYVQNTVDYAKVGDHYYSDKAPGAVFLSLPVYAGLSAAMDTALTDSLMGSLSNSEAFQSTLRAEGSGIFKEKVRFAMAQVLLAFWVAAIPSALLGVLLYRAMGHLTPAVGPRLMAVFGYGLATPAFAYANAFYGHQLSAALLFGAFFIVFTRRLSPLMLLLVGLLLGYSVVTEYPTALVVIILYLYTAYVLYRSGHWLRIGWVTLTGAVVAVAWMTYNYNIFGGPLELGYSYSELWQDQHHTGFMSLTLPQPGTVWGLTFGVFRGLFILSPLLLLAIPGFVRWWNSGRYRPELTVAMLSTLTIFLFNSSSVMWWGGFSIGPRYLLPALPFMAMSIPFSFTTWGNRRWFQGLAAILYSWSFIAVWGLTLAEQAFPPDTIPNPLLQYAWPNWLPGMLPAMGNHFGVFWPLSLVPLFVLVGIMIAVWMVANKYLRSRQNLSDPIIGDTANVQPDRTSPG